MGSGDKGPGIATFPAWGSTHPPGPLEVGRGRARWTYPEGALGHIDPSPGDNDGVLNGLGGHIGAAEGAIAIGDDLDVNGAAISVLWAPRNKIVRGLRLPQSTRTVCWPQAGHARALSLPR